MSEAWKTRIRVGDQAAWMLSGERVPESAVIVAAKPADGQSIVIQDAIAAASRVCVLLDQEYWRLELTGTAQELLLAVQGLVEQYRVTAIDMDTNAVEMLDQPTDSESRGTAQ